LDPISMTDLFVIFSHMSNGLKLIIPLLICPCPVLMLLNASRLLRLLTVEVISSPTIVDVAGFVTVVVAPPHLVFSTPTIPFVISLVILSTAAIVVLITHISKLLLVHLLPSLRSRLLLILLGTMILVPLTTLPMRCPT
jgi:hypothetical protein